MKQILSAAVLTLLASSAIAADLPARKEPLVPPPPPMWAGFYVGLNAGGTWSANPTVTTTAVPVWNDPVFIYGSNSNFGSTLAGSSIVSANYGGFIGGGQLGYNLQMSNKFVVGIEADIQGIAGAKSNSYASGINSALNPVNLNVGWIASTNIQRSLDYLGTVRGRIGYLLLPNLMIFGSGGLAYGGVNFKSTVWQSYYNDPPAAPPGYFSGGQSTSNTLVGWTAGGGVEWMFMQNWSAKVEYNYYDLGNSTQSFTTIRPTSLVTSGLYFIQSTKSSTRFNGNIVRAGVNYHFNWGAAPVVATY